MTLPRCGGVRLDRLTVGRCDRTLQKILEVESITKTRHARAVLRLVCGYAAHDHAMPSNPVRDVQRLPTTPNKESTLSTEQLNGIRELMQDWQVARADGPRPNCRILIDGLEAGNCVGCSQVFILVDPRKFGGDTATHLIADGVVDYVKSATPDERDPMPEDAGEGTFRRRQRSRSEGTHVDDAVWAAVRALARLVGSRLASV